MQRPARDLRQERALLGARRGDPDSPASGTLYARQRILRAELERAELEEAAIAVGLVPTRRIQEAGRGGPIRRSVTSIQRALRTLEEEIEAVEARIDRIDKTLARTEKKKSH